jgi:hypothetical protein
VAYRPACKLRFRSFNVGYRGQQPGLPIAVFGNGEVQIHEQSWLNLKMRGQELIFVALAMSRDNASMWHLLYLK